MAEEVFEINDYSTSSEWERFIADLEEVLTQWNLNSTNFDDSVIHHNQESIKNDDTKIVSNLLTDPRRWNQKQEQLKFGKVCFVLTLCSFHGQNHVQHRDEPIPTSTNSTSATSISSTGSSKRRGNSGLSQAWFDMNNFEHDWTASGHPLVRYYGLTQFLILSCAKNEQIDTEDRIKHLLGSATIALKNTSCEVPFFIQICQPQRRLFSGIHIMNSGFRTHFDMIQFPDVPSSFQYLSELITLYKKKLNSSFSYSSVQRDRITASSSITPTHHSPFDKVDSASQKSGSTTQISIRFTYLLQSCPPQYLIFNGNGPAYPALEEFSYLRSSSNQYFNMLPCSIQNVSSKFLDPLKQFQLATTWPSVAEGLIIDNAYHSDLQPRNAPKWSLRALFHEYKHYKISQLCWASQWLKNFLGLKIKHYNAMLAQFAGQRSSPDAFSPDSETDFRSTFDRLSSPAERAFASTTGNFDDWILSDTARTQSNYRLKASSNVEEWICKTFSKQEFNLEKYSEEEKVYRDFKASQIGGLSWKIAVSLCNIYSEDYSLSSLAYVWRMIVEKLREHWENGELLPGVDDSSSLINYGHCLFNQKLQMLNSCISQKKKRESGLKDANSNSTLIKHETVQEYTNEDGDEDEFYDCESGEIMNEAEISSPVAIEAGKAEGKLEELRNTNGQIQYRLDKPEMPIFIPQTQDPAPMTEDQHQQHIQIIGSLTNSPDDLKLKIRMQSSGLLSDMEAFKASNPDVCFEDFIRWHSPRDWVELDNDNTTQRKEKNIKYGLSRRMKESTLWYEIWSIAKPVPITRQVRLFNYTKEAEEILHSFESITIEKLVTFLSPILSKCLLRTLKQFQDDIHSFIDKNVDNKSQNVNIPDMFQFNLNEFETMFNRLEYENLIDNCSIFEYEVSKFLSILKKFVFLYESEAKKPFNDLFQTEKIIDNGLKPSTIGTGRRIGTGKKIGTKNISSTFNKSEMIQFVLKLLHEPDVEFSNSNSIASLIVRLFADSNRFEYENRTAVGERLSGGLNSDDYHDELEHNSLPDKQQEQPQLQSQRMFNIPQLPTPNGKEFILRARAIARPAPYSRPSSQKFYAFLCPGDDFRIASAFTEDTLYF